MRQTNADSISTFIGTNAARTFLARTNHGFCGVGSDWIGVVRKATLPREN